jgi:serine/threonine-protein kinase
LIQEGIMVGGYELQQRIGLGASAQVHRGRHLELQRDVAIKFLPTLHNPMARSRFLREAKALRRLDHPSIVQVLDTGEFEGTPYMVFDFIPGGSLGERMAAKPLTPAEALAILDGIAKGLDYAHGKGIIHRDVKPSNVLLTAAGKPVIADFGLVRLMEQPSATSVGMFAGTPAYMSPEQAEGTEVSAASDQYSLAAMAYEMLAGQVPFPGDTVSEVLTALLTRPPALPSTVRPGISPEVDAALMRGLAKHPEDRYPSCQALVDAILTGFMASLHSLGNLQALKPDPAYAATIASGATPDTPLPTMVPAGPAPVAVATPPRPVVSDPRLAGLEFAASEPNLTIVVPRNQMPVRRPLRRRLLLIATGVVVVLLAVFAIGAAWSGGQLSALGI